MLRLVIWPSMILLGWTETTLWALKYDPMIAVIPFKIGKLCDFYLSFFQIEGAWRDFTIDIKLIKKILRVYMVWGDAFSKLETFVWILTSISRSITWPLFTLKASYLVKWQISTWSYILVVSVYRFIKIRNSPQFPAEFRNGQMVGIFDLRSFKAQSCVCL